MSGNGNNGMDDLSVLVESFVEEVKPFLAGIRRGVAGIFAMPRDAQAITSARSNLSTIAASAGVLDLSAARQLGELSQLLDEAFQSAERGGVPDESRGPMLAMVDHLEEHLDGLLTGDDRGRERLDNVYRLLEQVLQTVEEAEATPGPNLDISLDDLLLTLQPTAMPVAEPQQDPAPIEAVAEPEKPETTRLVLLAEAEVAPIEWGEKEAKLWEKRGWDESQAAYGNTGWVFLDDDEDGQTHRGAHLTIPDVLPTRDEQPAPEAVVTPAQAADGIAAALGSGMTPAELFAMASRYDYDSDETINVSLPPAKSAGREPADTASLADLSSEQADKLLLPTAMPVAPEPDGTASLAELAADGADEMLLPMTTASAPEPVVTAPLAERVSEGADSVLLPTSAQDAPAPTGTASLAEQGHGGVDEVLLPMATAPAPEPVGTAPLAESGSEGADKVLLPTAAAGTGGLSIDADGLEEAALLALTPDQVETYLALEPAEQRDYLEARLGEMSDFAAELGLDAQAHAGADQVTDLIAALPSTGELLGKLAVPTTAPLGVREDDREPLAPAKRRARKSRRGVLPAAAAAGETGSLDDAVLHVAPAGDATGVGADAPSPDASEEVASADDLLLTEYRPDDHGTGVLGTDSLAAAERAQAGRGGTGLLPQGQGTDQLLPTVEKGSDYLLPLADDTPAEDETAYAAEPEDETGGSFLDALFEDEGEPGVSKAQVSSASDMFFDDDEGEIDPAYSAMPDVSPEIEAAFAQLSDADMATFLSLDGEAAMAFLHARASGEPVPVAEVAAASQPMELQAAVTDESPMGVSDLPEMAIDQEILEVFLLEMQELLAEWVRTAGQLRAMPANGRLIADLRRVAHTVKGAARMVGFHDLGMIGWRVEEVLDLLDERELAAPPAVMDFVDRSYALIERLSADTGLAPSAYAPETAELDRLHEELAAAIKAGELGAPAAAEIRHQAQGEDRVVASAATADAGGDQGFDDEEIDDELLGVFVQEADEHLAAFNRALVALDRNPADSSQTLEAKRVVHTLKGASAALGYPVTAALCHSIEDLFEQLDSTGRQPSREMMTLFFESAETLEALMAGITAGRGENSTQAAPLRARYAAFLKGESIAQDTMVQQVPVAGAEGVSQRGGEGSVRSVRVDIAHLDNLLNLVGELVINRTSQEQHLERLGRTVNELLLSVDRLRRVGFQLESRYEVAELLRGEQRPATGQAASSGSGRLRLLSPQGGEEEEFDALEMDRYTELHRISRELVEIASDVNAAGTELDGLYDNFDQTLSRQSRIATDLQDRMMEVRLVPISTLAARLYRAVRGVAQRRSRAVELVIEGETVEIDKVLLEEITDPLLHLVRNAADHGIESPQERRAAGKAAGGTIRLTAAREGNEAVIRVHDDGAGIDLDRVLEKAVARGVVRNRDGLTREQILDLIFLPGFSTSASVSDISGRGVGLDVVRTNVRRLKGTIDVESTPGVGTTFTIRLPIMLAVTRALLIRSGAQTFAIPLPVVEQVAFFRKDQVSSVGGGDLFDLGGETYPVVYLSRALGLGDTSETLSSGARALIVGNIERRIALVVDELVGQQEIVVKQLGRHLQSVAGVAGATILGNGQVVLILNVLDLIGDRRAVRPAGGRAAVEVAMPQPQPLRPIGAARGAEGPRVAMIVDDSLSVRRVLTRTLERDGWQVVGAKDGVEALEMLAWANPRVMVLDIEMPRMDGYELTSLIRNHPDYHDLPIAMLTSRAGEKHRRKAFDLGVSAYLVKPFEETDLLRTVRELSLTARQARDAG